MERKPDLSLPQDKLSALRRRMEAAYDRGDMGQALAFSREMDAAQMRLWREYLTKAALRG